MPLGAFAQTDEKAETILKNVSTVHKGYGDMEVTFSYTLENKAANMSDTRDGKLTMLKDKFRLELMGQDIYSDGIIVWNVMKEDEEVQVKTLEEFKEETDLDPANIFTQYEKGFKSKFHGEETKEGTTLNIVDLFPEIPGKKPFSRIRLGIEQKTGHINYSQTFGKDGTNYLLIVKTMKTNSGIPSELFVFNQKGYEDKGFDIVDFR